MVLAVGEGSSTLRHHVPTVEEPMSFSPKGQSWGSLAPELRFRSMRRQSRCSHELGNPPHPVSAQLGLTETRVNTAEGKLRQEQLRGLV